MKKSEWDSLAEGSSIIINSSNVSWFTKGSVYKVSRLTQLGIYDDTGDFIGLRDLNHENFDLASPCVPQFVADWFERNVRKEGCFARCLGTLLCNSTYRSPIGSPLLDWVRKDYRKAVNTIFDMEAYGYRVITPKKFYINMVPQIPDSYLNLKLTSDRYFLSDTRDTTKVKASFTEDEIKDAEKALNIEILNNPLIKLEEVE